MTTITDIFNAGRVRRYHRHPVMSQFDDFNDAHQGRVARIIAYFHPAPSSDLLVAALTHDDGEAGTADIPSPYKDCLPQEVRNQFERDERNARAGLWGSEPWLEPDDQKWLQFADVLDRILWKRHKAPSQVTTDDVERAKRLATELNIGTGM